MALRPLGDTLIVEPDPIIRHEGIIKLPDENSVEKISPFATVVSAGPTCRYPFRYGQRILLERFKDKPFNIEIEGKKYRLIRESYVHAVIE